MKYIKIKDGVDVKSLCESFGYTQVLCDYKKVNKLNISRIWIGRNQNIIMLAHVSNMNCTVHLYNYIKTDTNICKVIQNNKTGEIIPWSYQISDQTIIDSKLGERSEREAKLKIWKDNFQTIILDLEWYRKELQLWENYIEIIND